MRRWTLAHPYISLVLLALLLADAWFLPTSATGQGESTVGTFVRRFIAREPERPVLFRRPQLYIVREADGTWTEFDPEFLSMDRVTRAFADRPRDTLLLNYLGASWSSGFWAPTTRYERHKITMMFGENFSKAERAAARRAFAESCGAADRMSITDLRTLVQRDISEDRAIWLGHAHNLGALVVLGLLLASLRWVSRVPAWVRSSVGEERLARGECPRCRYSLIGLKDNRCPECGAAIPARG